MGPWQSIVSKTKVATKNVPEDFGNLPQSSDTGVTEFYRRTVMHSLNQSDKKVNPKCHVVCDSTVVGLRTTNKMKVERCILDRVSDITNCALDVLGNCDDDATERVLAILNPQNVSKSMFMPEFMVTNWTTIHPLNKLELVVINEVFEGLCVPNYEIPPSRRPYVCFMSNTLGSLSVSGFMLTPDFSTSTYSYTNMDTHLYNQLVSCINIIYVSSNGTQGSHLSNDARLTQIKGRLAGCIQYLIEQISDKPVYEEYCLGNACLTYVHLGSTRLAFYVAVNEKTYLCTPTYNTLYYISLELSGICSYKLENNVLVMYPMSKSTLRYNNMNTDESSDSCIVIDNIGSLRYTGKPNGVSAGFRHLRNAIVRSTSTALKLKHFVSSLNISINMQE